MSKFSKILIIVSLSLFVSAGLGVLRFSNLSEAEVGVFPLETNLEGKVYICPNAATIQEINPLCPGITVLKLGETQNGMTLSTTTYDGKEYYIVYGFENGGGGEFGTVEKDIKSLNDYILSLNSESFIRKNFENQKKALSNKISEVWLKIDNEEYQDAINKLQNDIRAKADGDSTAEDWIIDAAAQQKICSIIDNLVYYLRSL